MAELPAPIRAALGLAASVVDAAKDGRSLPEGFADKALELPVLAVTAALQLSIRVQQQYAALTVRGDEVLTQLRGGAPDEPPEWAQFDDETATETATEAATEPAVASPPRAAKAVKRTAAKKAPAKKAPAKKQSAKTQSAKTQSAKTIPVPRTGKPSAFDLVGGDD
jgi:hypothetical protein